MDPFIWFVAIGTISLALCLLFGKTVISVRPTMNANIGFSLLVVALLAAIPLLQWVKGSKSEPALSKAPPVGPPVHPKFNEAKTINPLKPGDAPPAIPAEGWMNSPMGAPNTQGKFVVLDAWALWCPICKSTAPGLVELSKKYAGKEVQFISINNLGESSTRPFMEQNEISWPSAYGVDLNYFGLLDAINKESAIMGYEVKPTILLLDRKGKIIWSDNHARYLHQAPEKTTNDLDEAIGKALLGQPTPSPNIDKEAAKLSDKIPSYQN